MGSAGIAACVAGLIGTWIIGHRINSAVSDIVGGIGSGLTFVENRTERTIERVEELRAEAHRLSDRFQERVSELVLDAIPGQSELAELEQELLSGIEQVKLWIDIARMAIEFADQIMDRASSTTTVFEITSIDRERIQAALQVGRDETTQALETLEEIQGLWAEIRTDGGRVADMKNFNLISARIDAAFEEAVAHVEAFRLGIVNAIVEFLGIEDRVRALVNRIAWIVTFLLVWQAIAHTSLTVHGAKLLRRAI